LALWPEEAIFNALCYDLKLN